MVNIQYKFNLEAFDGMHWNAIRVPKYRQILTTLVAHCKSGSKSVLLSSEIAALLVGAGMAGQDYIDLIQDQNMKSDAIKAGPGTLDAAIEIFRNAYHRCFKSTKIQIKRDGRWVFEQLVDTTSANQSGKRPTGGGGGAIDPSLIKTIVESVLADQVKKAGGADEAKMIALAKGAAEEASKFHGLKTCEAVDKKLAEHTAELEKQVAEMVAGTVPTRVEFVQPTGNVKQLGLQHKQFPVLLQCVAARTADGLRLNVWMAGPAGSGKTRAAQETAKALEMKFYFTGALSNEYGLLGFVDAKGQLVRTQFRDAYEYGGVFLFDEIDGSDPRAVLALNAALAGNSCAFPDGVVERHPDFVCIAAANTWGFGATNEFVGRMKQDAAFLDRFVQIAWEIDEALELATVGNPEWVRKVQAIRKKVAELGIKVVVSPRASYYGAALLATGMAEAGVLKLALQKAMSAEQWNAVQPALGQSSAALSRGSRNSEPLAN